MKLFPAIDLFDGKAVRLFKGDYKQMTVYSEDPASVAVSFHNAGAEYLHVVDLEGAKNGQTPNFETVKTIIEQSGLKVEIGGGIRTEAVIKKYIDAGAFRVILGTAAATDPDFLREMVEKYGDKIAVGCDLKDGLVATHGWTEVSGESGFNFFERMCKLGVSTVICTDISRDGVLSGTNTALYKQLSAQFPINIIASGGMTGLDDIKALKAMKLYGAILGKALYTGNIDLTAALAIAED